MRTLAQMVRCDLPPPKPKPNPKQPVVDPKDSHGSPTVGNRIQNVQSQGLAQPQSNNREHMSITHRCATAFWLSLLVSSQNKSDVLSYDLQSISPTLGSLGKCRPCEPPE